MKPAKGSEMSNVLIVDDIPEFLRDTAAILRPHMNVTVCSSPVRGVRLVKQGGVDLLITTLVMKEIDGFEVIRRVRGSGNPIQIIMVTGFGDENTAIEATRLGANDYLTKPVEPEELIARVRRALSGASATTVEGKAPEVLTQDPTMKGALEICSRVARSSSRVLILGETGTGKELFARTLHAKSRHATQPFVEVNCAAIPPNLLESELFGHERGAFTGATERRKGRFEEAEGGTLFLDEIGELGVALQSKLLRVLQTGDFNRVGGSRTLRSTARVIAATNRNLQQEVQEGRFRADLYYRLNVVTLEVPPLRDRFGDIPLLVQHFGRKFTAPGNPLLSFSREAIQRLCAYSWPGNVRELEHLIERLAVLSSGQEVTLSDLPVHFQNLGGASANTQFTSLRSYDEALRDFQKNYFQSLIAATNGNLAAAARQAGMDRSHFFRKVQSLQLISPRH
jgi:DNA-binding NtrC family response regulator